jgi:fatty acid desaturase
MSTNFPAGLFVKKNRVLSTEEIAEFGRRIDALRDATRAKIGEEDSKYIYRVRDFVRYTEIASRAALMFGGWIPPVWLLATGMLGVSKIVENMELGHNVMHGQYDWMNDPSMNGANYDWDTVCSGEDWKHTHNFMHHTYTNVLGKDHDIGYGLLRMTEEQKWEPRFLANLPAATFLMFTFQWSLALQNLHLEDAMSGKISWKEAWSHAGSFKKKAIRQFLKDYILFPVVAGPMFLPVLAGNVTANIIRNIWTFSIIFCGHFTEDVEMFEDNLDKETKSEWYLRQLKGSSNLTGGKIFHFLSGNLSHQIEHHMFPDMPANRYQEMASEVQTICAEFGQNYNTGSFTKQMSGVVKRIAIHSLPNDTVRNIRASLNRQAEKSGITGKVFKRLAKAAEFAPL